MTILRNTTLYPINSTTVDTGTGIDVRALSSTEPGATDSTQSVRNSTQGSNVERCFDPANASVTTTTNAATTLSKLGYGVPDASMTDGDSNCTTTLNAQSVTVNWTGTASGTGTGNVGANDVFTPRASLWKYNTSSNTGTLIVGGSGTAITISALIAYTGTAYTAAVTLSVPATTFSANEILYLQMGGNVACGAGLLGGARTTTWVLSVDVSTTKLSMAQGLVKACTSSADTTGKGTATRVIAPALTRSATGTGTTTYTKAVIASRSFTLDGRGTVTISKTVQAQRTFSLIGQGTATRVVSVALMRDSNGYGTTSYTKAVIASKSFSLIGRGTVTRGGLIAILAERTATGTGTITNTHPVQAYRTFNLIGQGKILTTGPNASTITLPIDEIPDGGGGGTTVINPVFNVFD